MVLVASAFIGGRQTDTLRQERDDNGQAAQVNADSVGKAGVIIADVCKAAPDKNIKATGREEECKAAEAGKIEDIVPVIEPVQIVQEVSQRDIERAVDDYMREYLTTLPAQYREMMRAAVVEYFKLNPPPAGKDGKPGPGPTTEVVAAVVIDYLQKNPPKPGADGKAGPAGVSVASVTLDSCDLVFTYSDQTTARVGPVCGAKGADGPAPTADELRKAFDGYCADRPGGTCQGAAGPAGYPTGWREADGSVCTDPDGDRFYTCEAPPPPTTEPPEPPADPPSSTSPSG